MALKMRSKKKPLVIITGNAGFIGSHVADLFIEEGYRVVGFDKFTYAANEKNVNSEVTQVICDIKDYGEWKNLLIDEQPEYIIHCAAESSVDKALSGPKVFIESNIEGTLVILEAMKAFAKEAKLVHVSTDEVFTDELLLNQDIPFTETTPYRPRNVYATTKAASDLLVENYVRAFGIKASITHCSNNVGPRQDNSKLIPRMVQKALANEPITLYGDGKQERDWLYVKDHAVGIALTAFEGKVGEHYLFGSGHTHTNLEVVNMILAATNSKSEIVFVDDRPGHDKIYKTAPVKAKEQLDWEPTKTLSEAIHEVVEEWKAK
jgi:dTDP-glucose 4,6-dehydratase